MLPVKKRSRNKLATLAVESASPVNKSLPPRDESSIPDVARSRRSTRVVQKQLVFPSQISGMQDSSGDDCRPHPPDQLISSDQHGRKKTGRKGTCMKNLSLERGSGSRIKITFDSNFEPTGPDKKSVNNFISYISFLARSKVSILINKWGSVSDKTKEQLWQALLEIYDLPNNEKLKDKWIQYVGGRWKAFKTSLGRYIFGDLQGVLPYVEAYKFLDPDTWEAFVASRQTPEFLAKRTKAQELQSNNKYPHRLSRGGYKNLKNKIVEEKFRARKDSSSDSSVIISPPSPPSRHESWKRARITPEGKYVTEEARVIADKIDSLEEQCSQGSFLPSGRKDILATAIGKPEHPGRVRGVGKGIGIREYFGPPQHSGPGVLSPEELDIIVTQVKQQTQQELQKDWEKMKEQMRSEMMMMIGSQAGTTPDSLLIQSIKESCVPFCAPDPVSQDTCKEEFEYELYVEEPQRQLVAYGRLHNLGPTIHHQQMNEDEVRVVVVRLVVGDARVPCPTDEVTTVEEASNQFITWPRRLIQNVIHKDISQPNQVDPKPLSLGTDVLKLMWIAAADITQPIHIDMDAEIACEKREDLYICQKDIMDLLQNQKLCVSVMQFYIKYLHNILKISGRADKFGLMCPLTIQSKGNIKQEIAVYIQTRIAKGDFDCFLAPYISDDQWQLMVLCPKQNVIAWFCSTWKKPKKDLINKIDTAFEAYHVMKGTHTHKLKKPTWVFPKCHKHIGGEACGYFVMRYMLEIIILNIVDSFEETFNMEEPYSKEDIDDVRRRWTRFLLDVTSLAK